MRELSDRRKHGLAWSSDPINAAKYFKSVERSLKTSHTQQIYLAKVVSLITPSELWTQELTGNAHEHVRLSQLSQANWRPLANKREEYFIRHNNVMTVLFWQVKKRSVIGIL